MNRRAALLIIGILASTACQAADEVAAPAAVDEPALSAERTSWPSATDPGLPYYARIEPVPPHVYEDGEWAIFVFYRDPACIRPDFDLIDFFDPPAAFGCPLRVSGSSIWDEAFGVGAPKVVTIEGDGAVPVWLLPSSVASSAVADGTLTIGELTSLPGRLEGTATRYREVVMPHPLPSFLGGGGHANPKIAITAGGALEDGRMFSYHLNRGDHGELHAIRLDIK